LQVDIQLKDNTILLVFLAGRIDSYTCMEIEEKIEEKITPDVKYVIFDFAKVIYISSAGLRVLMKYHKLSSANGGFMAVVNLPDFAEQVFELTGFNNVIPVFADIEAALSKITP